MPKRYWSFNGWQKAKEVGDNYGMQEKRQWEETKMSEPILRRCEVLKDGEWAEANFRDLKKGDVFRLWDGPEIPVLYHANHVLITEGNAYVGEDGVWTVSADVFEDHVPLGEDLEVIIEEE